MPVAVKDYSWSETEQMLYINVPLKGVPVKKVDLFSTEKYLKANYPPYIFECFLHASVHDQKCAAEVGQGSIVFKLEKHEPVLWGRLQCEQSIVKANQAALREEAHKRSQERSEELKKERAEMKREHDRFGVKQQIELEDKDRKRIESEKQQEIDNATQELERWKEHQQQMAIMEQEKAQARKAEEEKKIKNERSKVKKQEGDIFQREAGGVPMRETGKIQVNFSSRVFPTPTRESLAADEEAWLSKQAESRRVIELENSDLSEEERNPVWLRDKGNGFFQSGNYQAAINAYSHAIRMDSKLPSLFSNRGACHLKLGNFMKCIEDCSRALELLTPVVPQNAQSRFKSHVRRGTAFCHLELYVEGLMDYDKALQIEPNNEQLKTDAERIRQLIQTSSS